MLKQKGKILHCIALFGTCLSIFIEDVAHGNEFSLLAPLSKLAAKKLNSSSLRLTF